MSKAASIDSRSRCFTGFVGIKVDTQDLDVCTMKLNPLGRDARPRGRLGRCRVADRLDELQVDERLRRRQRARHRAALADGCNERRELSGHAGERTEAVLAINVDGVAEDRPFRRSQVVAAENNTRGTTRSWREL